MNIRSPALRLGYPAPEYAGAGYPRVEQTARGRAGTPDIPLWEQLCAGFVLLMLSGALIGPIFAPDQGENPVLRLFWIPSYLITAALVLVRHREVLRAWPALVMLGCIIALAYVSRYWSIDPSTTVRRVIAMTVNGTFAIYLGARFAGSALPKQIALTTLWMGVLSILFVIFLPHIGIHHGVNDGLWRGIWYEKNQMGWIMVFGGIAAAAWQSASTRLNYTALSTLMLCSILVLATGAKTSLLCLILGVGLISILSVLRHSAPALSIVALWLGVAGVIAGYWLWTHESAALLAVLGKDPTLTGRTAIWAEAWAAINRQPVLGYGYEAFWGREAEPANWIRHRMGWNVPNAHNGWLDLLLQLGWVGLVLAGIVVAIGYFGNLARLGSAGLTEGFWSISQLTVVMVFSLSESVLFSAQGLPWQLALACLARVFVPTSAQNPLKTHLTPRPTAPVPSPQPKPRLRGVHQGPT